MPKPSLSEFSTAELVAEIILRTAKEESERARLQREVSRLTEENAKLKGWKLVETVNSPFLRPLSDDDDDDYDPRG